MTNVTLNTSYTLDELNHGMLISVLPVTVFIAIETIFGLIGNTLIIVIYSRSYNKNNFQYFVLSMATIDLTSCCTTLPGEMFFQMNWYRPEPAWICKIKSFFNVWTALGSAFILLMLAFDRHRKIVYPLRRQLQPSLVMKLSVLSLLLATVMSSPALVLWGQQSYVYRQDNGSLLDVSICEKAGQFADGIYPIIYIGCVYILPVGMILTILCVLNLLTARFLFCMRFAYRQQTSSASVSQSSVRSSVRERPDHRRHSIEVLDLVKIDATYNVHPEPTVDECRHSIEARSARSCHNIAHCLREHRSNSDPTGQRHINDRIVDKTQRNYKSYVHSSRRYTCHDRGGNTCCRWSDDNIQLRGSTCSHSRGVRTCTTSRKRHPLVRLMFSSGLLSESSINSEQSTSSTHLDVSQHANNTKTIRCKPKTIIIFILTMVYVITMSIYIVLTTLVAWHKGIFRNLSNSQKVVFFFFWRLYFINCVINPILYGVLDPRFRSGLHGLFSKRQLIQTSG